MSVMHGMRSIRYDDLNCRMYHVVAATLPEHFTSARALFSEYIQSLPFSLDYQGVDGELALLGTPASAFAPRGGCILLAIEAEDVRDRLVRAVGCIAMRPLAATGYREGDERMCCEMKRMYVQPAHRGRGLGRMLCESLLSQARAAEYRQMKLDTEADFVEACALYKSFGFMTCERYNDDPMPGTIWMSKRL
jgi:putative acetyltransferase